MEPVSPLPNGNSYRPVHIQSICKSRILQVYFKWRFLFLFLITRMENIVGIKEEHSSYQHFCNFSNSICDKDISFQVDKKTGLAKFNSLPKVKILDMSRLEEFLDENINFGQILRFFMERQKSLWGKEKKRRRRKKAA